MSLAPLEVAIADALLPGLAVAFIAAVGVMLLLDRILVRLNVYRHVWYPALFRLAIFTLLFAAFGLMIY